MEMGAPHARYAVLERRKAAEPWQISFRVVAYDWAPPPTAPPRRAARIGRRWHRTGYAATTRPPRACLQDPHHLAAKPRRLRVLQRRDALAVGDVHVRARLDQQPHDLGVHRPAVAEDHGFEQRGPAELVDVILVDRGARAGSRTASAWP